ncbi:MAG: L-fucose:H+ symporter permease [Porphyromonas sp.]|nr:L-fucose:H+ symporter permease [Porphyromonas sp.]
MKPDSIFRKGGHSYFVPFLIVTLCFALWGFANDLTHPLVKVFSNIFSISTLHGSLVQVAFYMGYMVAALPAAFYIRKHSFASGIRMGLWIYLLGGLLFLPAALSENFYIFLIAYFVLTCGLSFLETSCNPYILLLGESKSASRRLNLAQSFNPVGSLAGMFVAMYFIQGKLADIPMEHDAATHPELWIVVKPYLGVTLAVLVMLLLFYTTKLPAIKVSTEQKEKNEPVMVRIRKLLSVPSYRRGVLAQFFYVGAQIMMWTYIIHYGSFHFMEEGLPRSVAEQRAQGYNIAAMILFCLFRFVNTSLMKKFSAASLLRFYSALAIPLLAGAVLLPFLLGLLAIVAISPCMSLMYPTIFSISLEEVKSDKSLAGALLVMAIGGGALLPPLQAAIIDLQNTMGEWAIRLSFIVPALSFLVIFSFAHDRIRSKT